MFRVRLFSMQQTRLVLYPRMLQFVKCSFSSHATSFHLNWNSKCYQSEQILRHYHLPSRRQQDEFETSTKIPSNSRVGAAVQRTLPAEHKPIWTSKKNHHKHTEKIELLNQSSTASKTKCKWVVGLWIRFIEYVNISALYEKNNFTFICQIV